MTGSLKRMAAHRPLFFQGIKGTDTACQPRLSRKQHASLLPDIYSKILFLGKYSLFGKDDSLAPTHPVICKSWTWTGRESTQPVLGIQTSHKSSAS